MQTFLIMVIIGGAGSFWGVVLAGVAMAALPEVLRFSDDWRMIIYGVVLLVAMLAMPGGVAGWLHERRVARHAGGSAMSALPRRRTICTRLSRASARSTACRSLSRPGSMTGLIGPNGSGKSTIIDCISGFQKLDGGRVVLAGTRHHGRASRRTSRAPA